MARRTVRGKTPAPGNPQKELDDLAILAPDRQVEVNGEKLTVREMTFGEQIAHAALLAGLLEAFKPIANGGGGSGIETVLSALETHGEALLTLAAISVDKPVEWVRALPGEAGEALLIHWWAANNPFFIRRLVSYPALDALWGVGGAPSAGEASLPPSPATGITRSG